MRSLFVNGPTRAGNESYYLIEPRRFKPRLRYLGFETTWQIVFLLTLSRSVVGTEANQGNEVGRIGTTSRLLHNLFPSADDWQHMDLLG